MKKYQNTMFIALAAVALLLVSCGDDEAQEAAQGEAEADTTMTTEDIPNIAWYRDSAGRFVKNPNYEFESTDIDSIVNILNSYFAEKYVNPELYVDEPQDEKVILVMQHAGAFQQAMNSEGGEVNEFLGTVTYMLTENDYILSVLIQAPNTLFDGEYSRADFENTEIEDNLEQAI